ncbi:MAG: NAD-dependent epimerase/dehydratase family protein [Bacilli bacterium]|nr:NAD-dependent epimerase/dehydratase family protein [Bacilli bacterium]
MKKVIYYITGATGHLGRTIANMLLALKKTIVAFILPRDKKRHFNKHDGGQIYFVEGDITKCDDIEKFLDFKSTDAMQIVIHCAGVITVEKSFNKGIYDINVGGTKNIVDIAKKRKVEKFVYVSSVHALKELPKNKIISEQTSFNPEEVNGFYAKTKAEASQYVIDACNDGLNGIIVHPSGIIGPNDEMNGHFTAVINNVLDGSLTSIVKGGYNIVDVRDVADGIIKATEKGQNGKTYLLSGAYHTVYEIIEMACRIAKIKKIRHILPIWFVKLFAPLALLWSKIKRQPPIFTAYSMNTLVSNSNFSNSLAIRELGFSIRPFHNTMEDTVNDLLTKKAELAKSKKTKK